MKISVLLVVNPRHSPKFLRKCLDRLASQSVPADEVVIVENGPIGRELEATIDARRAQLPVVRVPLGKNAGLRPALNAGLKRCTGELVRLMPVSARARFYRRLRRHKRSVLGTEKLYIN